MNESAMSHQRFVGPSAGGAEREPRMARMHAGRRRKWPYLLLLRKELRQALPTAGLFTLSIVAWHAFLYTRIGRWDPQVVVVSALLHLGFVPMWTLWRAGASLRQEWSSNHMSLLLTLPVPGWYMTSAKALVLLAEMLWYIVLVLAGTLVLAIEGSWIQRIDLLGQAYVIGGEIYIRIPAEALSWRTLLFALGVVTAVAASGIIATQFSYIAGCLWRRWSGLFSTAVAGLSVWFILRAGTLLAPLFRWVPEIPVDGTVIVNSVRVQQTMYLGLSPVFGALAAVALLFWLGAVLLERDVEL